MSDYEIDKYITLENWENKYEEYYSKRVSEEISLENILENNINIKNMLKMKNHNKLDEDSMEWLFLICCSLAQNLEKNRNTKFDIRISFFENLDEEPKIALQQWPTYWFGLEKTEEIKTYLKKTKYSEEQFYSEYFKHELFDDQDTRKYEKYEDNISYLGEKYVQLLYRKGNDFLVQDSPSNEYWTFYEEYDEQGEGTGDKVSIQDAWLSFRSINESDLKSFINSEAIEYLLGMIEEETFSKDKFYFEIRLITKVILQYWNQLNIESK